MSLAQSPRASRCVLLIHGLPQAELSRQREQFATISSGLQCAGHFEWATNAQLLTLRRRMRDGELATSLLPALDRRIAELSQAFDSISIVAFSFGAYLVYRWFADSNIAPEHKLMIRHALLIAAPFSCRLNKVAMTNRDGRLVVMDKIYEPAVTPSTVFANLAPAASLFSVFCGEDETILPIDSEFDREIVPQDRSVQTLWVSGLKHKAGLEDPTILRYVWSMCE